MELDLPRVVVGLAFLAVAAGMDWRRRRVEDEVWVALGAVALVFVEIDLFASGAAWSLHLMTVATAILYFGVFFGEPLWTEEGFEMRPARFALFLVPPALALLVWRWSADDPATLGAFYRLLTMPGMIVVAHGLYELGLLRGGADAKAIMALALLFPGFYPHLGSFPLLAPAAYLEPVLAVLFPLAFVVLVNSALLFVVAPLLFVAENAANRSLSFPKTLCGYRVPIDKVPKHAWLMDRIDDGKHRVVYLPKRTEDRKDQLRALRAAGFREVWVTPQIPFVTIMLVGYVLAVLVGNVLLALLGGLSP